MAVIACGLYLSRKSSEFFSATGADPGWAVWDSLTFVLKGLVFIGDWTAVWHYVISELKGYKLSGLILDGLALERDFDFVAADLDGVRLTLLI